MQIVNPEDSFEKRLLDNHVLGEALYIFLATVSTFNH